MNGRLLNPTATVKFMLGVGICLLFALSLLIGRVRLVEARYRADTPVSGLITINTTWDQAGNPYLVTGDIAVNNGVTLTIDPGVIIKFTGHHHRNQG